jgi:hypothetical protein
MLYRTVAPYSFPEIEPPLPRSGRLSTPNAANSDPAGTSRLSPRESRMFVLSRSVSVIIVTLAKEKSRSVASTNSS